jgi:hypothetical protein
MQQDEVEITPRRRLLPAVAANSHECDVSFGADHFLQPTIGNLGERRAQRRPDQRTLREDRCSGIA